ncbi:glycosyl hydrolase [Plebeiibacterium marinum]|uniref:Glycosyl hydrolase n=1 Tax=Plebeiibacterium marinum TaxID=2992111 RepID=A0AAE3ME38_9BACT|nr:glycosyl hydrolase [Plebeiobacterium marinum]MCW3805352.1 glycosyl hydrolase [Plebeiobacterium marinum]
MKKIYLILFFVLVTLGIQAQNLITEVESENGNLTGTYIADPEGTSSGQFVTGFDEDGDKVSVTVDIANAGTYDLVIRYRSLFGDKFNDLYVNGTYWSSVGFTANANFEDMTSIAVVLNAGTNTIEIVKNWGYVDVDKFSVYSKAANSYNITSTLSDSQIENSAQNLYDFIRSQYGLKIMTGQTSDYYDDVVSITGKNPLVRGFDLMTYTPMYPYYWDGSGHAFGAVDNGETDKVINWYNTTGQKGVVEIHWHWYSPSGGVAGTSTFFTSETTFDVSLAVISGTQENTDALRDIDAVAEQLIRIRDAGIPVIWRPLHEAGGGWFWWGAKGAEPCLALWDMVRDRLTNYHGLHNLIWCWSTPESEWYPGDNKVDILGFDSYPGAYNYTIQKSMFDTFHELGNGSKIVAMTENGPIPEIGDAIDLDARWSWFCAWNEMLASNNETQHIIDMYNHSYALTIENCPSYQNPSVATPEFNIPGGIYLEAQSIELTTTTSGATIYYTLDGSVPSTSSLIYNAPIDVASTTTIRVFATAAGLEDSNIATADYTISTAEFQYGSIYKLTLRYSGKVLEVNSASQDNGAVIQQNSDAGYDNQRWEFIDGGNGSYKLLAKHSGKALEVDGSSTLEGAAVVQWDNLANQSQLWNIESLGDGYYKIVNQNSGKALAIPSKRKNNGIPVEQHDYTGDAYQQWQIELIGLKSASLSSNTDILQAEKSTIRNCRVYPNPAKDYVNLDLSAYEGEIGNVFIMDLKGRCLYREVVLGGEIIKIRLNEFTSGCYLLSINFKNQLLYKKLLVD